MSEPRVPILRVIYRALILCAFSEQRFDLNLFGCDDRVKQMDGLGGLHDQRIADIFK
jgi:hypothetical protein